MKNIKIFLLTIFCLTLLFNSAYGWNNQESYSDLRQNEFIEESEYLEQFSQIVCIPEAQTLINKSKNITTEFFWYLESHPDYQIIKSGNEVVNWLQGKEQLTHYPVAIFEYPSNKVNAFALPGGFMFITSGLMNKFRQSDETAYLLSYTNPILNPIVSYSKGEKAFLLSHEFSHARAGNGFSQQKSGIIATVFMAAAYIFAKNSDNKYIRNGVPIATALISIAILSSISQDDEKFADTIATRETIAMGYPADSGITLLQKISGDLIITGSKEFDSRCYFKSHPDLDERIENIKEAAANFDNSIYSYFPELNQTTTINSSTDVSSKNSTGVLPSAPTTNGVTVYKINATYNPKNNNTDSTGVLPYAPSKYNVITISPPPSSSKQNNKIDTQIKPIH